MTLRQWTKYRLYSLAGVFPYFGYRVHFPKKSSAFRRVCEQGIFEAENVRILQQVCRPGSYMFDIGANLGLMAVPVLRSVPGSKVVSFEPSPNTLPWLRKTVARSGVADRWQLVEKALALTPGTADFSVSSLAEGLFDGLKHTGRSVQSRQIKVEVTNLDLAWKDLGCPDVSVMKIDVEGSELDVLGGGQECIAQTRPFVLLEWHMVNLRAYGVSCDALVHLARRYHYAVYALPSLIPVHTALDLLLQTSRTESFLMAPLGFAQATRSTDSGSADRDSSSFV